MQGHCADQGHVDQAASPDGLHALREGQEASEPRTGGVGDRSAVQDDVRGIGFEQDPDRPVEGIPHGRRRAVAARVLADHEAVLNS